MQFKRICITATRPTSQTTKTAKIKNVLYYFCVPLSAANVDDRGVAELHDGDLIFPLNLPPYNHQLQMLSYLEEGTLLEARSC